MGYPYVSGINRYEEKRSSIPIYYQQFFNEYPCVFLSHKSEDKAYVEAVGRFITSLGIDIYLDKDDDELQQAAENNNSEKIVKYLEQGLSNSTHLLCIVSEKTMTSPWVPYEIGYAKKTYQGNLYSSRIATLFKNDVAIGRIPSFLEIEKTILSIDYLRLWLPVHPNYYPKKAHLETLALEDYVREKTKSTLHK